MLGGGLALPGRPSGRSGVPPGFLPQARPAVLPLIRTGRSRKRGAWSAGGGRAAYAA